MQYADIEKIYWDIVNESPGTEPGISGGGSGGFDAYYSCFQKTFRKCLEFECGRKQIPVPEFSTSFNASLFERLQQISMRTLILEMRLCEQCGELLGRDGHEQYLYYADFILQSSAFLKDIYEEYPFMYQDLLRYVFQLVQNIVELLERFEADQEDINHMFYPDRPCHRIEKVGSSGSDDHQGGHKVYFLELDNKEKIVYKHRSLAVDVAYLHFLQWVFHEIDMPLCWNKVIDRKEYGWSQWVSPQDVSTYEELRRYYKRCGILLCISYLLGSEDIHYENLIAHGEYPIIVDLEMAIGSRGLENEEKLTEMERIYRESVSHTGILPLYAWNEAGEGISVGAMDGKGGQTVPFVMPVVIEPGTVKMHVEYRHPNIKEGKNLVKIKGGFVEPYELLNDIQGGFEEAYCLLMKKRLKAAEMLEKFDGARVRYLVRNTQQYMMLLTLLGHPKFLAKDRDLNPIWEVLDHIGPQPAKSWLLRQEMEELWRGDIPYFYLDISGCDIYSGNGECFPGYFPCPIMESVKRRLIRLCEADLKLQKKLIRSTLLPGKRSIAQPKSEAPCRTDNISVAGNLGNSFIEEAIWLYDKKELGWFSVTMTGYEERGYMIRPMNDYLYDGLSGMALFFAKLAKVTGQKEYYEIKEILVDRLFRHTNDLYAGKGKRTLPTGIYAGEASISFAYEMLYFIHPDPLYLTYMERQCQITAGWLEKDAQYDIMGGNAGAVMAFLNAYTLTGQEQYLSWAKAAGDCLLISATAYPWGVGWVNSHSGEALTGFAHGNAGIMLALARLGHESGDGRYMETAKQAYRYEEHYYRKERKDWEDLRYPKGDIKEKH